MTMHQKKIDFIEDDLLEKTKVLVAKDNELYLLKETMFKIRESCVKDKEHIDSLESENHQLEDKILNIETELRQYKS